MPEYITAIVLAAGIPTAVVGLLVWRLEKRIEKRDREKDAKEKDQIRYQSLQVTLAMASLTLGEATAEAIQRIPDANCNGDMHAALEAARTAKREYRTFENEQTAKAMHRR